MSGTHDTISARSEGLTKCDQETLERTLLNFEFLPEEYAEFLSNVGWGEVAGLMFYSGPLELEEIFDKETAVASAMIVLIADDMAGGHLGYVKINEEWLLTDFDHMELPGCPSPIEASLRRYVASRLDDLE